MSQIFDALQKSEVERSGIDPQNLTLSELLRVGGRNAAAEREAAQLEAKPPVGSGTGLPSVAQPGEALQPLSEEGEERPARLQSHPLDIDDKQRDELMKLVQQVFVMRGAEAPRTVVLASTEPGNGCSWISCRVADILASYANGPVCIVDANLHSPGLHEMFGVENHYGLSDALQATASIRSFVRPLCRQNLWLLSSGGATDQDRRSLLSSDRMRLRLVELRGYFKYILIDSPALSLNNEAIISGRAADGIILVLKASSSRRDAVRKAVEDIQNAGVCILGAILNQRTFPIPQKIYDKL